MVVVVIIQSDICTNKHINAQKKNSILKTLGNLRKHTKLCTDLFACNNKLFSISTNMSSDTAVFKYCGLSNTTSKKA